MKKIIYMLWIGIFLISLASAAIPTYPQDTAVEISHAIRSAGEIDPDIIANVTIRDPDNILIIGAGLMTFNVGSQEHTYTLPANNTHKLGVYNYNIDSTNGSISKTSAFSFEITITGDKPTTSQSLVFFAVGFLSIILFMLSLLGAIKIPWKNKRNQRGVIVGINDLKYVKLLLWFVTYLLLIFITFAFSHISRMSNWDTAYNYLNGSFLFLTVFLLPIFILTFLSGIISFFNDKKTMKLIDRNLKPR